MKRRALGAFPGILLLALFSFAASFSPSAYAPVSRFAEVDGVKLHHLTLGQGAAVILPHGYAETSLMWKPIIPLLAERFTLIAPELPGIGDSAIPADGLDMRNAAIRIHAPAQELCLAAGIDGYLTKPIRPQKLDALLERYTRAATATAVPVRAES
jgi:pimeloyl-ACP methyl ester carboxylesterase